MACCDNVLCPLNVDRFIPGKNKSAEKECLAIKKSMKSISYSQNIRNIIRYYMVLFQEFQKHQLTFPIAAYCAFSVAGNVDKYSFIESRKWHWHN